MINKNEQDFIDGGVVYENGRLYEADDTAELKAGWMTAKARHEFSMPQNFVVIDKEILDDMKVTIKRQSEALARADVTAIELHDIFDKKIKEWKIYHNERGLVDKAKLVMSEMQRNVDRNYHNTMAFRDTVLTQMGAIILMAQACLMADTHREKDSRIRGLVDIISTGIDTLKNVTSYWYKETFWGYGLLKSDSTIPQIQRENWELQRKLDVYTNRFGQLPKEEESVSDEQESPF